jgi:hypothetical protein
MDYDDETTAEVSETLSISDNGVVSNSGSAQFRGYMDELRTVVAWTDTWAGGTTEIGVLVGRRSACYSADLVGTWGVCTLATGTGAPWWERGTILVDEDGAFSGTMDCSDGTTADFEGTLSISVDGVVTSEDFPNLSGYMNTGKTLIACTDTWDDGTTEILMMVRLAPSYTAALRGTWGRCLLASGPSAPWWGRGRLVFLSDGSFAGTMRYSDASSAAVADTLEVAADGTVTSAANPDLGGFIDSGRFLLIWTDTWGDGTTEINILVKQRV